jgi:hypothetical protein
LLQIDTSNPAAVTFTATSGNSSATASTAPVVGVTLNDFFTSNSFSQPTPSGTGLAASGFTFDSTTSLNSTGSSYTGTYMEISSGSSTTQNMNFVTGATAFTGTMTLNLTGTNLPAGGATGDIFAGAPGTFIGAGTKIGTWQVGVAAVPEPSTYAVLLGVAALCFAGYRHRNRRVSVAA